MADCRITAQRQDGKSHDMVIFMDGCEERSMLAGAEVA